MLVELIGNNYHIQDGLINGVESIFRASTTTKSDTIWNEFFDPTIGTIQQKEMLHFFKDGIMYNWTPMTEFVGIMNQTLAVV